MSLFFTIIIAELAVAQDAKEYKAEIGIQAGGDIYAGDVNTVARKSHFSSNMSNIQPDFGAFFRYKFNSRVALRLGFDATSVQGNYLYSNAETDTYNVTLNNNSIKMVDLWGEYNFFDYENNKYKRYSKTYSPYIFVGLGYIMMPASKAEKTSALALPFGFGLKVKLATRWNLNLQWSNRLLFADNLEGLPEYDNPMPKTVNNMLNYDLLSGVTVGLSFDFWERECDCISGSKKASKAYKAKRPLNNSRSRKR
ncbi:MAG: DUF6089 family protein [Paludibacteraceae bacterium]